MGFFRKNKKELTGDIIPKGVSRTLPRPTEEDLKRIKDDVDKLKNSRPSEPKIDTFFLQEISDRLYGPDSEAYVQALKRLNNGFRPRNGKNCLEFYEPEIVVQNKERERKINNHISKETR